MYSGTTLTIYSGRLLGAHQKIDRAARKHLETLAPATTFPKVRKILHFEGGNGPDAIKRKSPAKDEPWHYMQPFNLEDNKLLEIIESHYKRLVMSLQQHDEVRSAFEAAWLAHAIVDGLTPAHHYPYEEELNALRNGKDITSRTTFKEKVLFPGDTLRAQAKNNWKYWGPKGLFTTHWTFEWGTAMLIAPLRLKKRLPADLALQSFQAQPIGEWFRTVAQDVARMELYDAFYETGWTVDLANKIRKRLAPTLVQAVSLVWYAAAQEANILKSAA